MFISFQRRLQSLCWYYRDLYQSFTGSNKTEKKKDFKKYFFFDKNNNVYIRYKKCHVMIVMIIVIPISPQVIVCWDWLSGPCSCDDEVCQKQRLTHLHVNRQPCQKKEKFKKHFQKDDFNEVYQNFEIITSKLLLFESYSHYKDN